MRSSLIPLLALGALLSAPLAACDGEDPVDAALRDAAAARHAQATRTTEEIEAAGPGEARSASDADAIAQALQDAEADLTRYRALLASTDSPRVRRLAQTGISRREAEVAELRVWRAEQN